MALPFSVGSFFLLSPVNVLPADEPPVPQSQRAVEALGVFESIRATEAHVYGYIIALWRESGSVFGLLSHYEGPPEPASRSIIPPVRLADSGEFKFSSMGNYYRYSFSGLLSESELKGVMESAVIGRDDLPTRSERVSLRRKETTHQEIPAGYIGWRKKWESVLK